MTAVATTADTMTTKKGYSSHISTSTHPNASSALHVGGPLLGVDVDRVLEWAAEKDEFHPRLAPVVATLPSLPHDNSSNKTIEEERYIFLPSAHSIQVRSWKTGQRVAVLVAEISRHLSHSNVPSMMIPDEDEDEQHTQEQEGTEESFTSGLSSSAMVSFLCTALTPQALVVGCSDACLRCFALADIRQAIQQGTTTTSAVSIGPFSVPGPVVMPHQTIHLSSPQHATESASKPVDSSVADAAALEPIRFVASASNHETSSHQNDTATSNTLYVLQEVGREKTGKLRVQAALLRIDWEPTSGQITTHCVDASIAYHIAKPRKERPDRSRPVSLDVQSLSPDNDLVLLTRATTIGLYRVARTAKATVEIKAYPTWQNFFPSRVSCVAWEQDALAVGLSSGEIHVWQAMKVLQDFLQGLPPVPAQEKIVIQRKNASNKRTKSNQEEMGDKVAVKPPMLAFRKLHWHSHPVASLQFHTPNMLYSGGVESVLVQWQLHTGMGTTKTRPSQVLPRVALAALTNLRIHAQSGQILLVAADETLQVFELYNQSRLWQIQGWPSSGALVKEQVKHVWMQAASTYNKKDGMDKATGDDTTLAMSNAVLVTGLSAAPGRLVWYSPHQQQIIQTLTVTPYNRVSPDPGTRPWPVPVVTHAATALRTLVTVDQITTENTSVGKVTVLDKQTTVGSLTTLRFWQATANGYRNAAVVASPHGPNAGVDALALSPSGLYCCTIHHQDEGSFRIWKQIASNENDEVQDGERLPQWVGSYKVRLPSGYANHTSKAISFSSDDSVLAIAFEDMITLWDTRQGSFLTCLDHLGYGDSVKTVCSPVDSMQFLTSGRYRDALVSFSSKGVVLQSPFGALGPQNVGWTWELPSTSKSVLTCFTVLGASESIVLSLYNKIEGHTNFCVVDVETGKIRHELQLKQATPVIALAASADKEYDFFAMTRQGNLFRMSVTPSESLSFATNPEANSENLIQSRSGVAPVVAPLVFGQQVTQKRQRTALVLQSKRHVAMDDDGQDGRRKRRLASTSLLDEENGEDLPRLQGTVTRWFLHRHLEKS